MFSPFFIGLANCAERLTTIWIELPPIMLFFAAYGEIGSAETGHIPIFAVCLIPKSCANTENARESSRHFFGGGILEREIQAHLRARCV